jgi:glycosyltransferase involved in cell wall biosynthesis
MNSSSRSSIVVNGRFATRRMTGVQRYAHEIVARLGNRCHVLSTNAREGIHGHRWEQTALPLMCRNRLLWSPCNTGPLMVRRQVVTIHDMAFQDTPDCFGRAFSTWYRFLIPRLARRVVRVVTVSEYSRLRIAELTNLDLKQIAVVPNGVDARFKPADPTAIEEVRRKCDLAGPYVLVLGSVQPRKNLIALLQAWRMIQRERSDLTLAVAGAVDLSLYGTHGMSAASVPNVRRLGYVDDEALPALYTGAEAFVFPSIYEGFGLPPLEAMACGAAVICSNATSLPEVVGDAGILVGPNDINAMADAILRVTSDPALRRSLGESGRRRAELFTWESAAERTWQVLACAAAEN